MNGKGKERTIDKGKREKEGEGKGDYGHYYTMNIIDSDATAYTTYIYPSTSHTYSHLSCV